MTERDLPPAIRRHAERAILDPGAAPADVLIHQEGEMRLKPEGGWMPFTAEQRFSATRVEFVWHARVKMAPLMTAVVDDAYENGHGSLDVKVWGIIPVAHAEGFEIDRGEAQRYLAELPWNPMALLHNPELQFAEREDGAVRVWVDDPQTYVDLTFDEAGDILSAFTKTRYRDEAPQPWGGTFDDYREFGPVRVPTRGHVSWFGPEGEFRYWHGLLTSWDLLDAP